MDTSKNSNGSSEQLFRSELLSAFHSINALIFRFDVDSLSKDVLTGIMGSLFLLSRRGSNLK